MSKSLPRRAPPAGGERDARASARLDGAVEESMHQITDWHVDARLGADCAETVESGSGLGAFYAYQTAIRRIERG